MKTFSRNSGNPFILTIFFHKNLKKTISRQKNRETLFTFYLRNTERIPFHFILTNIFFRENVFQNQK